MFKPFTENARKTMVIAGEEARRLGSLWIDTQHILMAVIGFPDSTAVKVLKALGVEPGEVRKRIDLHIGYEKAFQVEDVQFSKMAKRVIESTFEEVEQMGSDKIGTGHLLIGLLMIRDGLASRIMAEFSIYPDDVRREVRKVLNLPDKSREMNEVFEKEPIKAPIKTTESTSADSLKFPEKSDEQKDTQKPEPEDDLKKNVAQTVAQEWKLSQFPPITDETAGKTAEEGIHLPINDYGIASKNYEVKFTVNIHKTIANALIAAYKLGGKQVETEHLLLGILMIKDSTAVEILKNLGQDPDNMTHRVSLVISSLHESEKRKQSIPFSPNSQSVMNNAFKTSDLLGSDKLRTEHLLLALMKNKHSVAGDFLENSGVNPEELEEQVRRHSLKPKTDRDQPKSVFVLKKDEVDFPGSKTVINSHSKKPVVNKREPDEFAGEADKQIQYLNTDNYALPVTDNTRKSLNNARMEAYRTGRNHADTEDLLMGILEVMDSKAVLILKMLEVNTDRLFNNINRLKNRITSGIQHTITFSPEAQKVIISAIEEAEKLGSEKLGTEHLLLALMMSGPGIVSPLLGEQGLTTKKIRQQIIKLYHKPGADQDQPKNLLKKGEDVFPGRKAVTKSERHHSDIPETPQGTYSPEPGLSSEPIPPPSNQATFYFTQKSTSKDEKAEEPVNEDTPSKSTPFLDAYCHNLTQKAKNGDFKPVSGWQYEIDRIIQILSRYSRNNPLITGESQVSVRAIMKGLAFKMINYEVPKFLWDIPLLSLELDEIISFSRSTKILEDRIRGILEDIKLLRGKVLLFIPDIYQIFGPCGAGPAVFAPLIIKSMMTDGILKCVCSTTSYSYEHFIKKDPTLERSFFPIELRESTVDETLEILRSKNGVIEKYYKAKIEDEVLLKSIKLAERYIKKGRLPEKAVDLVEEAAARYCIRNKNKSSKTDETAELEKSISELEQERYLAFIRIRNKWDEISRYKEEDEYYQQMKNDFLNKIEEIDKELEKLYEKRNVMERKNKETDNKKEPAEISFLDIAHAAEIRFDVLLYFDEKDRKEIRKIAFNLEEKGIKAWTGDCYVPPGSSFYKEVETVFSLIKTVAFFLGKGGKSFKEKDMELLMMFKEEGKQVIPVILRGFEGELQIPGFPDDIKYVDYRSQDIDSIDQIIWGIAGEKK